MTRPTKGDPQAITAAAGSMLSGWVAWLWYVLLSAIGLLAAIAMGFVATQFLTNNWEEPAAASDALITEGRILRGYANEISGFAAELGNYGDIARLGEVPTDWLEDDFRPRFNDFRRRLSSVASRHPAMSPMLTAADSIAKYASRPTDERFREAMRSDVMTAVGQAESAIAEMGVAQYLGEPARLPGL